MSPTRRRSARLRGNSETPKPQQPHTMHRLSALAEHDEPPNSPVPYNLDAMLSSPSAIPRTPLTAGRIRPGKNQMHPSMAKPSTAKEPDSGLRLGFKDIPTERAPLNSTPSKIGVASSTSFDFRYAPPTVQLGDEARKLMDSLREESDKIKAKLSAQHEEDKRNGGDSTFFSPRKIAQPKPKAGRYSDVHMAQFKKMDSIAGHPSAFRAQPDRSALARPSVTRPTVTSALKRTKSNAQLDEDGDNTDENAPLKHITKSLKRTKSKAQLDEPDHGPKLSRHTAGQSSGRLGNTAPSKRSRQEITDDASTARPVSRGDIQVPKAHGDVAATRPTSRRGIPVLRTQKPKATLRSRFGTGIKSLSTPTKASAARASGPKQPSTPSMATPASMANLNKTTPKGLTKSKTLSSIPRPEHSTKPQSSTKLESIIKQVTPPSKFDRFKAMLHRNPSPAKVPVSASFSIPTLKKSPTKMNFSQELPSLPETPVKEKESQNIKHVVFTSAPVSQNNAVEEITPSLKKTGIPRSATMMNLASASYPSLSTNTSPIAKDVQYPILSTPRPVAEEIKQPATEPPARANRHMFTFRTEQQVSFGSSPGQTQIRAVRPSILPSQIPGSFPVSDHKEDVPGFQTIPHGMSNKKRHRASSNAGRDQEDEGQSPTKKLKSRAAEGQVLAESLQKKILLGNSPKKILTSPTKNATPSMAKGVLSLARLNMLARPKNRK